MTLHAILHVTLHTTRNTGCHTCAICSNLYAFYAARALNSHIHSGAVTDVLGISHETDTLRGGGGEHGDLMILLMVVAMETMVARRIDTSGPELRLFDRTFTFVYVWLYALACLHQHHHDLHRQVGQRAVVSERLREPFDAVEILARISQRVVVQNQRL